MISKQLFANIRKGLFSTNLFNHNYYSKKCFILKSNICYNNNIDITDKLETENSISYNNIDSNDISFNRCIYCVGSGVILCKKCNGYGKSYYDGIKEVLCNKCNSSGYVVCNYCSGHGKYINIL